MFKIETDLHQKIAYVYAPFDANFNENVKNKYAARWIMSKNAWCIKIEFVSDIREKMKEIFGRDDTYCEKLVSLKIIFHKKVMSTEEISFMGRTILFKNKDNKIQKGYGVIIPPNSYRASKGEIEIDINTQVIVRDFQIQKLNEIANLDSNVEVKIIHDDYDLQMLASEKKSILERLNEVEKMIQKMEDEKNAI